MSNFEPFDNENSGASASFGSFNHSDTSGGFSTGNVSTSDSFGEAPGHAPDSGKGRWHAALTLCTFPATAAVAFLLARLTGNVESRPVWMLALLFAAPVLMLMFTSMMTEIFGDSMNPTETRRLQALLACACVLLAGAAGCLTYLTNTKATHEEVTEVTENAWSDTLIILDKSGSMAYVTDDGKNLNDYATKAVKELVEMMDESCRVGLLIDVGWEENNDPDYQSPIEERIVPIATLDDTQKMRIRDMAEYPTLVNENFICAFDAAIEMLKEVGIGDNGAVILIISDGDDCTRRFQADQYSAVLQKMNVKVEYLYVIPDMSTEMVKLAQATGGRDLYVKDLSKLGDEMQEMTTVTVTRYETTHYDALRTINESSTSMVTVGILMPLTGAMIGVTLYLLFSRRGQFRVQLILSPLMGLLAFGLLAMGEVLIPMNWIREGIAFSLFGIVFMRKNSFSDRTQQTISDGPVPSNEVSSSSGPFMF